MFHEGNAVEERFQPSVSHDTTPLSIDTTPPVPDLKVKI